MNLIKKEDTNFRRLIIISTLVVGICSITYELLISTVSSYFLGDSVYHFSITIGFYLASMGFGSYLSRYSIKRPYFNFVLVELVLGMIGTISIPVLYYCYAAFPAYNFNFVVLSFIISIGILTGFEIPLLTKILEEEKGHDDANLSDILTFDYVGALISTILFPLFFIPYVGLFKTSILFGSLNIIVGLLMTIFFIRRGKISNRFFKPFYLAILAFNLAFYVFSSQLVKSWQALIYRHPVVYHNTSPYQDIVITQMKDDMRLYLNGAIQFSTKDEYRYHEALVHIPAISVNQRKNVLVLGGGEGLALRELLKYNDIEHIDLVELDPAIVDLTKSFEAIKKLNQNSLSHQKVTVHIEDAFGYIRDCKQRYDLIIADLPDPTNDNLSRLYSDLFFSNVFHILNDDGVFVTQSTNPSLTSRSFWCIEKTLAHSGFNFISPYKVYVPSFGEWGFIMASKKAFQNYKIEALPKGLKYVNQDYLKIHNVFSQDVLNKKQYVEVNKIDHPIIHQYYFDEFGKFLNAENRL